MRRRILFLATDAGPVRPVIALLELNHFEVREAADDEEAADLLPHGHFDVIVVELRETNARAGFSFLQHLQGHHAHLMARVVIISSGAEKRIVEMLSGIGICDVVPKPIDADTILKTVRDCIGRSSEVH